MVVAVERSLAVVGRLVLETEAGLAEAETVRLAGEEGPAQAAEIIVGMAVGRVMEEVVTKSLVLLAAEVVRAEVLGRRCL